MAFNSKEQPTRIQPPRAAKTTPIQKTLSSTAGGRVSKNSKSPRSKQKQVKSPKGATKDSKKSDAGGGDSEGTDTENPFANVNNGRDNFLKPADIVVGNIISTGYHEAYADLLGHTHEYRSKYVRESGDSCGYVHTKYRKFVIVALFKKHFVALPIYSNRLPNLHIRQDQNEYAEIIDSTLDSLKPARFPRPHPLCRGRTDDIWLWSKSYSTADRGWSRMADTSVAWLARPVAHGTKIRAKVISKLEAESVERLLRWTRDCLVEGLEAGVREHLRVLGKEKLTEAPIPGPGPWGK
ncbi:hypothetical protein V493_06679 [Pseudogymnoascus sp. VKM F-4281 (FW-2241)]|nr:hypothetical protein V493_06679 [Pseudogymnoascus sp. VKM F-4281 (FW-2241)]